MFIGVAREPINEEEVIGPRQVLMRLVPRAWVNISLNHASIPNKKIPLHDPQHDRGDGDCVFVI